MPAAQGRAPAGRRYGSPEDLLGRYGWYAGNSLERPWPVGQKRPNDLGLFDMLGNAWTWCHAADGGPREVLRGGSFAGGADDLRSAARRLAPPAERGHDFGLRVARTYR